MHKKMKHQYIEQLKNNLENQNTSFSTKELTGGWVGPHTSSECLCAAATAAADAIIL